MRVNNLLKALPPARYVDNEPPVRGALRLIADHLLRAAEMLDAHVGDLISSITCFHFWGSGRIWTRRPHVADVDRSDR